MPRVKSRKPRVQDRPSARTLLLRRLRRIGRPVLLAGGAGLVLAAIPLGMRGVVPFFHPLRAAAGVAAFAGFRVEHVELHGVTAASRPAIERALDLHPGTPILDVSPAALAARISALGAVRDVTVERQLPDTIVVQIAERAPLAIWQRPDGRFALIGRDGAVLADRDAGAARALHPDLKLLVGSGAPDRAQALLDLLAKFPAIGKQVVAAELIDDLRWNLILRDRTVVELPDQDAGHALAVLRQADQRIQLLARPVRTIDLRFAGRLIVRPYPKGFITDAAKADATGSGAPAVGEKS